MTEPAASDLLQRQRDTAQADCAAMREAIEAQKRILKLVSSHEGLAFAHGFRYTPAELDQCAKDRDLIDAALAGTAGAALLAERERHRETLEWYGDASNYEDRAHASDFNMTAPEWYFDVLVDRGERARRALGVQG